MNALSPLDQEVEVHFSEWPLIVDWPSRREWGWLELVVTVEHQGQPDLWDIVEIEFDNPNCFAGDRHPVPEALRQIIEVEIRGREQDREKIRHAISEQLSGMAAINKRAA